MKITYLGHSAFYLESDNFAALIDPFITGNPQAPYGPEHIQRLTHIFVTHGHGDHMGDTIPLAKRFNALVIANFEIGNYLSQQGCRVHPMHIGGRKTFDFGVVKMTTAVHGSAIQTPDGQKDGGNPCGFVITVDGLTLYHAGDTGLTLDMQLLKEEKVNLAMLPIGGNFTMDVRDASKAVTFIEPKAVIPMHYNTFAAIQASVEDFEKAVNQLMPSVSVLSMKPGDHLALSLESV